MGECEAFEGIGAEMMGNLVKSLSLFAMVLGAALAQAAQPATRPSTAPSDSPASELQEWLILVSDPNSPQASASFMYGSSMPEFSNPRRPSASGDKLLEVQPMGLIRLYGEGDSNDKIDVLLNIKGGRFMGNWPKAINRTTGLLWQDMQLKSKPTNLETVNEKHWFNRLRAGESAYLVRPKSCERFIAYDLEIGYANPVHVQSAGGQKLQLWDAGSAPLYDLTIYRPSEEGWRATTIAKLDPSNPPTTQPTTQAATKPATAPATQAAAKGPTTRNIAERVVDGQAVKDAGQLLAPWKEKLAAAGLKPVDFDLILEILAKHALDSKRMTIVYRLDASEMERLLPIEVVPQPRKMTRVGLVILRNIDPAIGAEIDTLIAQLGDANWARREEAQKQLTQLGLPAKPKLEQAQNNKDLEIAWRAERLLARLNRETSK